MLMIRNVDYSVVVAWEPFTARQAIIARQLAVSQFSPPDSYECGKSNRVSSFSHPRNCPTTANQLHSQMWRKIQPSLLHDVIPCFGHRLNLPASKFPYFKFQSVISQSKTSTSFPYLSKCAARAAFSSPSDDVLLHSLRLNVSNLHLALAFV